MRYGVKTLNKIEFDTAINKLWTISRICKEYKIHNRIWYASLEKYGKEDWNRLEYYRRSKVMRGNRNGCKPPTNLPNKEELIKCIQSGMTQADIRNKFNGGERLFHRWIEWYGLCNLWNERFDFKSYKWLYDEDSRSILEALYPNINITSLSYKDMRRAQRKLLHVSDSLKKLGQLKQKREGKTTGVSWSKNQAEIIIEEYLESKDVSYIRSYKVGKYFIDFYLPQHDTYVEVDGSIHELGHKKDRDKKIDVLLGCKLHRIRARKKSEKNWEHLNEDFNNLMEKLCL